jgi:hypothetical protein
MRKLTIAAIVFGLGMHPAFAQTVVPGGDSKPAGQETSRADCLKNFRAADADGDGILSVSEAENAKSVIPTGLALPGPITEEEFMAACTANVPKGG